MKVILYLHAAAGCTDPQQWCKKSPCTSVLHQEKHTLKTLNTKRRTSQECLAGNQHLQTYGGRKNAAPHADLYSSLQPWTLCSPCSLSASVKLIFRGKRNLIWRRKHFSSDTHSTSRQRLLRQFNFFARRQRFVAAPQRRRRTKVITRPDYTAAAWKIEQNLQESDWGEDYSWQSAAEDNPHIKAQIYIFILWW